MGHGRTLARGTFDHNHAHSYDAVHCVLRRHLQCRMRMKQRMK